MPGLLKKKLNLEFIVNPFHLYCLAFSLSIIIYLLGWSSLFPHLSGGLILFFGITFILFIIAGLLFATKRPVFLSLQTLRPYLNDIIFFLIILLCFVNVIYMGYVPVLDRSHNYREFGMPVIDPLFNTLSIFFSLWFFHSFLNTRKKKLLIFFLIILIIQLLLYRRSTIIWVITSSSFLFLLYKRKISLLILMVGVICIPLISYSFGLYGNTRSKLTRSFVINDLGASDTFRKTGISHNHYMTYLYLSSPLANLQANIDKSTREYKKGKVKDFIFYCLIPESFTRRLEKPLHLSPPVCYLISPELIAGSFFMTSFYILGWWGMITMFVYLSIFILICLFVIRKCSTFGLETFSILCAAVSLLIFSNFLNRLDVILMLFVYPILFHIIFTRVGRLQPISSRIPTND
jgi:hypothetical protein